VAGASSGVRRLKQMNTPARLRERAAYCRALANGRITRKDATEWLDLADKWDAFADRIEASAARDVVEYPPPRAVPEQRQRRN
jgi:hypothetical protein